MGKMLIGTDDYGLYQAVSATLESLGLETVWALNGLEVIQEAEAEPADAVFLDSAIGVINLFECCAALRGTPLVDKKLYNYHHRQRCVHTRQCCKCLCDGAFNS